MRLNELRRTAFVALVSALVAACGSGNTTGGGTPGTPDSGSIGTTPDSSLLSGDAGSLGDSGPGGPDGAAGTDGAARTDSASDGASESGAASHAIKTVFVIMMENRNWSDVTGDSNATYINGTLVPSYAHANNYKTPPGNHPSEPNYIWLEAGNNLNITTDDDPGTNHQSTTEHLVTQLTTAGVSWKAYVEDITAGTCPLMSSGLFACKHTPMLFFDDVTNTNSATAPVCIDHIVPYSKLAADLTGGMVARYNFITPNLCDDMHDTVLNGCSHLDQVEDGDQWLSANVPPILASSAYQDGGLLLILWDEGSVGITLTSGDGPIGAIVLSPLIKSPGYSNTIAYTHSSTLKTVEEIFGAPLLRGAADPTTSDLSDFFTTFP